MPAPTAPSSLGGQWNHNNHYTTFLGAANLTDTCWSTGNYTAECTRLGPQQEALTFNVDRTYPKYTYAFTVTASDAAGNVSPVS